MDVLETISEPKNYVYLSVALNPFRLPMYPLPHGLDLWL